MILKFLEHGEGGGNKAIKYVYQENNHKGEQRHKPPETIQGDPRTTAQLINSCPHKFKYKSFVLSFTKDEYSDELAKKVLTNFEEAAFAGLEKYQYDLLIVKHEEKDGTHFHGITPRMELTTGMSYNICTPGQADAFWGMWSRLEREKQGLDEPIGKHFLDRLPLTSKEYKLYNKGLIDKLPHTKKKLEIDSIVRANIINGLINNRKEIILYLETAGYEISRVEKNYISIKTESRPIKFWGGIYANDTDRPGIEYIDLAKEGYREPDRKLKGEALRTDYGSERDSPKRNRGIQEGLETRYERTISRHKTYVADRYRGPVRIKPQEDNILLSRLQKGSQERNEAIQLAKRSNDINKPFSQPRGSHKDLVKAGNTQDASIQFITQLISNTTDPVKRAELHAQLASLTESKADSVIDTLTSEGNALRI